MSNVVFTKLHKKPYKFQIVNYLISFFKRLATSRIRMNKKKVELGRTKKKEKSRIKMKERKRKIK